MPSESDSRAWLALTSAPNIARESILQIETHIEAIKETIRRAEIDDAANPGRLIPGELVNLRADLLAYLRDLAAVRSESDKYLRVMISHAMETQLLSQRDIANAAGVGLHTAQSWAAANKLEADKWEEAEIRVVMDDRRRDV